MDTHDLHDLKLAGADELGNILDTHDLHDLKLAGADELETTVLRGRRFDALRSRYWVKIQECLVWNSHRATLERIEPTAPPAWDGHWV
ncbi:MAG: hypothetical protein HYR49_11705 [Gammaproteobacteria bacterium]|nr:hypothetical protein [Gammaproteobacteria bacterium]